MNRITLTIYSVIGISAALLFDCTSPADQAGNSSQLGNGRTAAMLFNADGTPATGAKVVFVPVDYTRQPGLKKTAGAVVCSTTTDSEGNYRFASVPGGTYNIFGEGDSGLSYQDSVPVAAGVAEVENDTLRQPGTLQGYVKLSNGLDYKTVYLLVPGSMVFSAIDSGGLFELAGMAEGTYPVRFFTLLDDWEPKDTVLAVVSGVDTLLADSIELKFKGVPAPRGLIVGYDTLNETVLLKWDAMDTALVDGFNIYRAIEGENFSLLTKTPLPDTATGYADGSVEIDTVYEYRVVARNRAGEESRLVDIEDDIVKTVSCSEVTTTVSWAILGTIGDTASIGDTVGIVVTYSNPTRVIREVAWYIDGSDTAIEKNVDSSLSGSDTLMYQWDEAGGKRVNIIITDDAATQWCDSFWVAVVADSPVAQVGTDTTVSINDTFFVDFNGSDRFGAIIKYRIDLDGDGTYDDSASENGRLTGEASS
ncbi:MAG: hypothetical protein JXA18_00235, partial [Chitinispirillaceae bacterium]|nr:hypothetical protein [Chitinispirillaceae bacterium]